MADWGRGTAGSASGRTKQNNMAAGRAFPRVFNLWSNSVRCLHLSTFLSQIRVLKRPVCSLSDFNPLFEQDSLPLFQSIEADHVVPGIRKLTQEFENDFQQFEESLKCKCYF